MWDFATAEDVRESVRWADAFVREQIEPLDALVEHDEELLQLASDGVIPRLQKDVKEAGLWAWHLTPEDGGMGSSQVNLAVLQEVLGRSTLAPVIFGNPGTDSGNMEILARFGSASQRKRFLEPLAEGRVRSCFAATEPQGGADPMTYRATAEKTASGWLLSGEKWFASGAKGAAFILTIAITDPDAPPRKRFSMFVVPGTAEGIEIVSDLAVPLHGPGRHAHVRFSGVTLEEDSLLGPRGGAFQLMQARMGPARLHMAMRATGLMLRAFEMMCSRARSRTTQGGPLAEKQLIQAMIADSWTEIEQYRLLVMRAAWRLDQGVPFKAMRPDIAALKSVMPDLLNRVVRRSIQVHGSMGLTTGLPLMTMMVISLVRGIGDGPTEVHKISLAKDILAQVEPDDECFPSYYLPALRQRATELFPELAT